MIRPTVTVRCVADNYHAPGERIVEFTSPNGLGGLLALHQHEDGKLVLHLYRCDNGVQVVLPDGTLWTIDGIQHTQRS